MRVKIEVIQGDIDRGVAEDPCECALARAFARALPGTSPYVTAGDVELTSADGEHDVRILLPFRAVRFVGRFDNYKHVEPETFFVTGIPREFVA